MSFNERLSTGWELSQNSFRVLKENKKLLVFPILSGISLLLVLGSFMGILYSRSGFEIEYFEEQSPASIYGYIFLYYLVNYFFIVFFNIALTHCTRLYFQGEEVTLEKGLKFSLTRIGAIFSWALFAATIGTILKAIQENAGVLGKIITGIIGVAWGVSTFFVVPIVAYENLGPIGAFKRSVSLMKAKWGESLGATFSFGLIQFIAVLLVSVPLFLLGSYLDLFAGIGLAVLGIFCVIIVFSAAETIFVSAVYHEVTGNPVEQFNRSFADKLFVAK